MRIDLVMYRGGDNVMLLIDNKYCGCTDIHVFDVFYLLGRHKKELEQASEFHFYDLDSDNVSIELYNEFKNSYSYNEETQEEYYDISILQKCGKDIEWC